MISVIQNVCQEPLPTALHSMMKFVIICASLELHLSSLSLHCISAFMSPATSSLFIVHFLDRKKRYHSCTTFQYHLESLAW